LITGAIFLVITGISVGVHLRRQAVAGAGVDAAAACRGCPRCGERVPDDAASCPACGVPQQAFEVITAELSAERPEPMTGASTPALHALVRADRCVGCGTCVAACPEPGALRLVGKVATIETTLCKAHGDCVKACPVGAITLSAGTAVQEMVVPEVDAAFESNLQGVHIVGELGGRGLIKNAINEGKIAVEAVVAALRESGDLGPQVDVGSGNPAEEVPPLDLIIVGSGPAGLSAGLEASRAGLNFVILEQGSPADSIRRYPRHKILLSEPVRVPLYGDLWVADSSKEALLEVWDTIIKTHRLQIRTSSRVDSIRREADILVVDTTQGPLRTRRVVLAMGRRGTPRQLGVQGESSDNVFYEIVEMEAFAGRRILVVGGGDSAIESAVGLANQPGTTVHLSYRGEDLSRVKPRNRTKFEESVRSGLVVPLFRSQVMEIGPGEVVLRQDDREVRLPNDFVIVRIGGSPPLEFLERIGVRVVRKDVPLLTA